MIIVLFYILCILLVLLILFRLLENKKAKQICRVLDRLLVDIALRGIVENYDRRHNKNKKNVVDENTFSTVKALAGDEPIREVARLIDGGKEVSQTALEHYKKLFEEK